MTLSRFKGTRLWTTFVSYLNDDVVDIHWPYLPSQKTLHSALPTKVDLQNQAICKAQETFAKLKIQHFWHLRAFEVFCQSCISLLWLQQQLSSHPRPQTIGQSSGGSSPNSSVIVFHGGYHRSISHLTDIILSPLSTHHHPHFF